MQKEFKLIAIRPAKDNDKDVLKALKGGTLYQLCHEFTICDDEISYQPAYPARLFGTKNLSVSIAAVAGRNGSGKSTLFELLFAGLYNLSVTEQIFDIAEFEPAAELKAPAANLDLFYMIGEEIIEVNFRNAVITYTKFLPDENAPLTFKRVLLPAQRFCDITLFYSVVINYSFYALNSREMGQWISHLFHKNDSYQTPIVINPLRNEGNIDINREKDLVLTRLLFSILQPISGRPEDSLRHVAPGKIAKKLTLILDKDKVRGAKMPVHPSTASQFLFSYRLPVVYEVFLGSKKFRPMDNVHNFYGQIYVMRKLASIADTYVQYEKYAGLFHRSLWQGEQKNREPLFAVYLAELALDHSHVTFKLRRAIHSLKYEFYDKSELDQDLPIADLSELIYAYSRDHGIPFIELLPPSFLRTDIEFEGDQGYFAQLSSGEKQKVFSTYSIVYHLINLDNVHPDLRQYGNIACILDEIELYYHPEMQRTYVFDLLETLNRTFFKTVKNVQMIFITHSPFILSDIPKSNILYLKINEKGEGLPEPIDQDTFGANIYDLLSHSFYFENGFIGEKAKRFIQDVIDNLLPEQPEVYRKLEPGEIEQVIAIIGEPFLKEKLLEMYEKKFKDRSVKQREIDRLNERIERLKR